MFKKGEPVEFEGYEQSNLNDTLAHFYADARRKDGQEYRKSSIQNVRNGLKRHILEKCGVDISGPGFDNANKVFAAKMVDLKRQGKGDVRHKDSIEPEDLTKLYTYFEQYDVGGKINPQILQHKVFFDLLLHFCR